MYPLPQQGRIIPTGQVCDACGSPTIQILMQNRGKWTLCLNMSCPKKAEKAAKKAAKEDAAKGEEVSKKD
jgi:DNA topoisomerase-1